MGDEVIWATSTTGEDFQCVHVDAWREAQGRTKELDHLLRIFIEELDAGRLIIGSIDDHPNETKAGLPPNYWHGRWLEAVRSTLERHDAGVTARLERQKQEIANGR